MRRQTLLRTLVMMAAMFGAAAMAQAQETPAAASSQQKDQKAAPKPRKVWTDEDFASSHPAADASAKGKGALSAGETTPSQDVQKQAAQGPPTNPIVPKTLEEADKLIQETTVFANDEAITLARKQKELAEAPEDQKAALQKEVEMHQRYMRETSQELKAYQDKKKELEKKKKQTEGQSETQN